MIGFELVSVRKKGDLVAFPVEGQPLVHTFSRHQRFRSVTAECHRKHTVHIPVFARPRVRQARAVLGQYVGGDILIAPLSPGEKIAQNELCTFRLLLTIVLVSSSLEHTFQVALPCTTLTAVCGLLLRLFVQVCRPPPSLIGKRERLHTCHPRNLAARQVENAE